jgi:hypothetical protein
MDRSLKPIGWLLSWVIILLTTNRWLSWQEGIEFLSANDALTYGQIAKAAPGLSPTLVNFHHAQRLIAPYLVGILADTAHVPISICFRLATYGCLAAIVIVMHHLLRRLHLTRFDHGLSMGLLVLNPYLLRYYLLVPGLLPDVVFVVGTAVLLWGLVAVQTPIALFGILLAAIGRQTALFLVPGLLVWVLMGDGWRQRSLRWRLGIAGAIVLLPILTYVLTAQLASHFALTSINAATVTGLFPWLRSPRFSWDTLANHCLRLVIPILTILGLLISVTLHHRATHKSKSAPSKRAELAWSKEQIACLLMTAGVLAQPFLAGPDITGQNATRLATLGFLPILTALALGLQRHPLLTATSSPVQTIILPGGVLLGSLHHLYTTPALPNAVSFVALQLGVTVAIVIASTPKVSNSY